MAVFAYLSKKILTSHDWFSLILKAQVLLGKASLPCKVKVLGLPKSYHLVHVRSYFRLKYVYQVWLCLFFQGNVILLYSIQNPNTNTTKSKTKKPTKKKSINRIKYTYTCTYKDTKFKTYKPTQKDIKNYKQEFTYTYTYTHKHKHSRKDSSTYLGFFSRR